MERQRSGTTTAGAMMAARGFVEVWGMDVDVEPNAVTCDVTMIVLTLLPSCVMTELKEDIVGDLVGKEDALEEVEVVGGDAESVANFDAAVSPTTFCFLSPPREKRSLDVLQQD